MKLYLTLSDGGPLHPIASPDDTGLVALSVLIGDELLSVQVHPDGFVTASVHRNINNPDQPVEVYAVAHPGHNGIHVVAPPVDNPTQRHPSTAPASPVPTRHLQIVHTPTERTDPHGT